MLGPIERYALRFVESYYPNGLNLPADSFAAFKKGATAVAATTPVEDQPPLESTPLNQEGEEMNDSEVQTKIGAFGRRVPLVAKMRGRGRAKTVGVSSKLGILQTPGGRSFPDYFSGKEPKAKSKPKRKGRGRGGWRGRPREPGLGSVSGSGSRGFGRAMELDDGAPFLSGSLDSPREIEEEEEEKDENRGKQEPDSDREVEDESEAEMSSDGGGGVGDYDDEL